MCETAPKEKSGAKTLRVNQTVLSAVRKNKSDRKTTPLIFAVGLNQRKKTDPSCQRSYLSDTKGIGKIAKTSGKRNRKYLLR